MLLLVPNAKSVNESFDTRLADFINEMTASLVEHSKEFNQQIKLRLGHANARGDHGAVVLVDSFISSYQLIDNHLLGCGQPSSSERSIFSPVAIAVEGHTSNLPHGFKKTPVAVSCEHRLSEISPVLLVQAFSELHRRKRPFVGVQLEVRNDAGRLALLPFSEVEQRLLLPRIWMLPVDSGKDLLRKDFIDPEGSGRPLPVEPFGRTMIEVGVLHVALSTTPNVVLQKLICYDVVEAALKQGR